MSEARLEDHLIVFYLQQELRPQKLAELRGLGEIGHEEFRLRTRARSSRRPILVYGSLATAAFVLLLGAFYLGRFPSGPLSGNLTTDPLARSIGKEIAMNHKKQLPIEFSAEDYAGLQLQMNKLDFALAPPSSPATSELHVIGARYCSIQGQLAAQIRLRDSAGRVYTLYETKLTDKLREVGGEVRTEGIRILLWRETGVFCGLAVNEPQSE
jgi:hypothetical protein